MKILLVGGNGFIGSHLVDALLAQGDSVCVLSPRPEKYREPLPDVTYLSGSFGDSETVKLALAYQPDCVVHMATYGLSVDDAGISRNERNNLDDSVRLFEACAKYGVPKIAFLSTGGKIYGIPRTIPVNEEEPTNPLGSYAITKLSIEKYLLSLSHYLGFQPVILRPSNPFGIRQSPIGAQGVIPIFAWRMLHGQPIVIWGDGNAVRDYIDVRDAARVCAMAATRPCSGVFNVGSGVGISIFEIVDLLADIIGVTPIIRNEPARNFDIPAIVLDSTRAQKQFDWKPSRDFRSSLIEVVSWLKKQPLDYPRRN